MKHNAKFLKKLKEDLASAKIEDPRVVKFAAVGLGEFYMQFLSNQPLPETVQAHSVLVYQTFVAGFVAGTVAETKKNEHTRRIRRA